MSKSEQEQKVKEEHDNKNVHTKITSYPGTKVHYASQPPKDINDVLELFDERLKKCFTPHSIKSLVNSTILSFLGLDESDDPSSLGTLFVKIKGTLLQKYGEKSTEKILTESLEFVRKYTEEHEYTEQHDYLAHHDPVHNNVEAIGISIDGDDL